MKRKTERVALAVGDAALLFAIALVTLALLFSTLGCGASAPAVPCSARDVAVGVCRAACEAIQSAPCASQKGGIHGSQEEEAATQGRSCEACEALRGDVLQRDGVDSGRASSAGQGKVSRCEAWGEAQSKRVRGGLMKFALQQGYCVIQEPLLKRRGVDVGRRADDGVYECIVGPDSVAGRWVMLAPPGAGFAVRKTDLSAVIEGGRPVADTLLIVRVSDVALVSDESFVGPPRVLV